MSRKIKTDDELLAMMPKPKSKEDGEELDLDIIGGGIGKPAMSEIIDAGRSDAGHFLMDESGCPLAPSVKAVLGEVLAPVSGAETSVAGISQGRDLVNQLLGQAQMAGAFEGFSRTVRTSKLAHVKENKLYRDLKGSINPHGAETLAGTWEEFCGLLGCSVDQADRDIANLRTFGEEALEGMSRMGIGYRELSQYRKLPAECRNALAEAAKNGSKDDLLELAEDLLEKERASKTELEIKTVELAEDVKVLQRREKNYEAEIERAQSQVKRLLESKKRTTEFLPRTEEIREECMALQLEAELPINTLQKLFEEVRSEDAALPEWRLQIEQVWIAAHVVAARALDMVERMKNDVREGDMPERIQGQHILSPAEAERWMLDYPMIENRHAAEKAARQEKRDAAKPKGPGRPAGSKNKAAGE